MKRGVVAVIAVLAGCDPGGGAGVVRPGIPVAASVIQAVAPDEVSAEPVDSAQAPGAPSASTSPAAPPVSVTLPAELPTFRVRQTCKTPTCTFAVPGDVKKAAVSEVPGRVTEPATVFGLELAQGGKIGTRANAALAAVLVVLAGEVSVEAAMGKGKPPQKHAMKVLDGIFVDGGNFSIASEKGAKLVVALVGTMKDDGSVIYNGGYWAERPGGDQSVAPFALGKDVLHWGGGQFGASIGLEGPRASCTLLAIASPAGVALHEHEGEWEMLAILAGKGTIPVGSGEKRETWNAEAGALPAIPKATEHGFQPTELPMVALQFYVPPGPEQRFKKLAGQ